MKFWDTSAIVPLLAPEEESRRCARLLTEPPVVWGLSSVEALSALERRGRETDNRARFDSARQRLRSLRAAWTEVRDLELVRDRAERLLAVHALRAADALQLAAALVATEERPRDVGFVCLDSALREAAAREGFQVLP